MIHGPRTISSPDGLAVPRQLLAVVVDDLHVDAEHRAALLGLHRDALLGAERQVLAASACTTVPTGLISVMPQACSTCTS